MSFSEHARPFLTFHVGQAGVQIGHAIWELLCLEHNIDLNGNAKPECQGNGQYDSMFIRNSTGHFMPRSILVDTDPTCIDEVRVGPYRNLFSATQLLSDLSDSGNNYMRGRHGFKNRLVPDTLERFRSLIEKTESTPCVFLIHSVSGGTGSGLAVSCLEALQGEFGSSLEVIEMNVSSGRTGLHNSCEIINQVLYLYESRNFTNVSFTVTNSAMYNVCRSGLNITHATYAHLNRILAMCFSNLTAMERFPGTLPCTIDSICSNVRPFKHMKNLVLACAPFLTNDQVNKERINTISVTSSVMEADSQLADVDLRQGRHMAGVLLFRGAAKPTDVEQAVNALRAKNKIEFVDWAPPSFKTGLIELPPLAVPSSGIGSIPLSVTLVSNHTSIASLFRGQTDAIKKLSPGGYFLKSYDAATGGGEVNAGHNSKIASLLQEACNHMDSIAKDCEGMQQPPNGQEDEDENCSALGSEDPTGSQRSKQGLRGSSKKKTTKIGANSTPELQALDKEQTPQTSSRNALEVDKSNKKQKEGSKKSGCSGGCCKRREKNQTSQPRVRKRSISQNQANCEMHDRFGSTSTESESFRSANCADRRRTRSAQSFRRHIDDFSSESARSTDSVAELSDFNIQDSWPFEPQETSHTLCAVKQIIQKYNRIFNQGTPSVASPIAVTSVNLHSVDGEAFLNRLYSNW